MRLGSRDVVNKPRFCHGALKSCWCLALKHGTSARLTSIHGWVIQSFADRDTERLCQRQRVRRLPASLHRAMLRKLVMLDAAEQLEDLRVPPGNRLEKLRGDRAGQHSIRVNDQWRVCFRWRDGHAHDVAIVDYH
jgi:proteic killer suppression protein